MELGRLGVNPTPTPERSKPPFLRLQSGAMVSTL